MGATISSFGTKTPGTSCDDDNAKIEKIPQSTSEAPPIMKRPLSFEEKIWEKVRLLVQAIFCYLNFFEISVTKQKN
jgi:hypothetical protein